MTVKSEGILEREGLKQGQRAGRWGWGQTKQEYRKIPQESLLLDTLIRNKQTTTKP